MERKEILLVEDDPGDTFLAQSLLRGSEFVVLTATTLGKAVECFNSCRPDLVLLDLGLPDSHGMATYDEFRSACPDARILVWSGLSDEHLARHLRGTGAFGYVVKTYLTFESGDTLKELCRKVLASGSATQPDDPAAKADLELQNLKHKKTV